MTSAGFASFRTQVARWHAEVGQGVRLTRVSFPQLGGQNLIFCIHSMPERKEGYVVEEASPVSIPSLQKPVVERLQEANLELNLYIWPVPPKDIVLQ